jgi:hypothetical protein
VNEKLSTIIISRIPSKEETQFLFAICLFPTHIFAFLSLFRRFSALLLKTNLAELLAVFAYVLSFTFFESLSLTLLLVLLAILLPCRLFRDLLIPKGALFVLVITIWSISLQAQGAEITNWYLGFLLFELLLAFLIVSYSKIAVRGIQWFVERMAVLSYTYLLFDILSIIYLITRAILL